MVTGRERGKVFSQQYRGIGGQDVGYYIIGDAAYPLTSWLIKPFPDNGALTHQQETLNLKTSKARVVVCAFGRLKGRWRCLQKCNDCSLERVVLRCCVLHNLCESHSEEYREEWSQVETTLIHSQTFQYNHLLQILKELECVQP